MEETRRLSGLMRQLERALADARGRDGKPGSEQRVALRVPTYLEVDDRDGKCTIGGGLVEVSEEGAFMRAEHPSAPGTRLRLEVRPEQGGEGIELVAEVVWTRETADEKGPAGMGVRFEGVSAERCRESIEVMGEALVARLAGIRES